MYWYGMYLGGGIGWYGWLGYGWEVLEGGVVGGVFGIVVGGVEVGGVNGFGCCCGWVDGGGGWLGGIWVFEMMKINVIRKKYFDCIVVKFLILKIKWK